MPRYIDADELGIGRANPTVFVNEEYAKGWNAVIDILEQAPTLSPDEVRGVGKWEQKEIYGVEETTIEQMQSACCSVCRKYHTTPYLYYFDKYNYCPNCGARMTEVSEDA